MGPRYGGCAGWSFLAHTWFEETDGDDSALDRLWSMEFVSSNRWASFRNMAETLRFIKDLLRPGE